MKENISFCGFCDRFSGMGREKQFSYEGKKALFEYLEQLEQGTGEDIELDVIALCCGYSEYEDIHEYLKDYGSGIDAEDYEDEEDYIEAVKDEIRDKTSLIDIDGEGFIIQAY